MVAFVSSRCGRLDCRAPSWPASVQESLEVTLERGLGVSVPRPEDVASIRLKEYPVVEEAAAADEYLVVEETTILSPKKPFQKSICLSKKSHHL
jgi:hypothetical protein